MNRTSEKGEDAIFLTIFLKERKKAVGKTAHTELFFVVIVLVVLVVFNFYEFTSFTFFLPPLHQTGIYHWESSLSLSQGYLNTKVTLKKKRLSIQGD